MQDENELAFGETAINFKRYSEALRELDAKEKDEPTIEKDDIE